MKDRIRGMLWDAVTLFAAGGLIYSVWELIEIKGWWIGLPISLGMGVFGYLAMQILYPLWFWRR